MTQAIFQVPIKAVSSIAQAMTVAAAGQRNAAKNVGPKVSLPSNSHNFTGVPKKYMEPGHFQMKVNNVFMTWDTNNAEKVPRVKHWLSKEMPQFTQTLIRVEKEPHKTLNGLYGILTEKFRPQQNEAKLSSQSCKFSW